MRKKKSSRVKKLCLENIFYAWKFTKGILIIIIIITTTKNLQALIIRIRA